ncbi:GUN4 domain-containing protein [Trichocoleus sp. FACHB-591]|uniref:GUN4 domain-containing protein n=1 Tax=Trichocoleus TaxID=450526 RepID=UPI001685644F|nr:GUN4 domain-containing protein [Trichocoleus sp. FACHB-591]MBD2093643.1 GUN4 domain-containing protein [Trichocoleus sp. FACHB-591]
MSQQLPDEHYQTLSNYLESNQWKEADQATTLLMQQSSTDLLILDELWTRFSAGRFGFSIQSQIWQEVGCAIAAPPHYNYSSSWESGDSDFEQEKIDKFAQRVGWINNRSQWVGYEDLNFSLNAPYGHLPIGHGRSMGSLIRRFSYIVAAKNV